jgi:hypothetical protein
MALATYPRLSVVTRLTVKNLLDTNEVFAELDDDAKNACIDFSAQDVCNFRNSLNKEDYWFSSDDNASVFSATSLLNNFDWEKKGVFIAVEGNEIWKAPIDPSSRLFKVQSDYTDLAVSYDYAVVAPKVRLKITSPSGLFDKSTMILPSDLSLDFMWVNETYMYMDLNVGFGILTFMLLEPKYTGA